MQNRIRELEAQKEFLNSQFGTELQSQLSPKEREQINAMEVKDIAILIKKKQILGWNSSKEEGIGKIVKEANGSWGSSANIEQWITA